MLVSRREDIPGKRRRSLRALPSGRMRSVPKRWNRQLRDVRRNGDAAWQAVSTPNCSHTRKERAQPYEGRRLSTHAGICARSRWEERPADDAGQRKETGAGRSDAEIMLAITDLLADGDALPELFGHVAPLLQQLAKCELVNFAFYEPSRHILYIPARVYKLARGSACMSSSVVPPGLEQASHFSRR